MMPMQVSVPSKTGNVSRTKIADRVDLVISQQIRVLARMEGLIAGRTEIANLVLANLEIWQPALASKSGAVARTLIAVIICLVR